MDELPLEVRGSEPPTRGPVVSLGSPRRPGLFVVVALVVVAALAVAIGSHRSSGRAVPTTTASVLTTPETTARATTTSSTAPTTATTVVEPTTTVAPQASQVIYLNQPSLPSVTHTELVVHGAYGLDRTDLDQGRTISTPLPSIIGGGQRPFMIAGSRSVLVGPISAGTVYLVPDDGGPAQPLLGRLAVGTSFAYPGPMLGLVWLSTVGPSPPGLDLVGFDVDFSHTVVANIDLRPWGPDGTGQVVLVGVGGAYVTGSGSLTRVTTGEVLAAGPTTWLVRECDEHHVCTSAAIDRRTGHKTLLKVDPLAGRLGHPTTGVISPDGATAAIAFTDTTGEVDLIDTRSGDQFILPQPAARVPPVWSLDSRYLFFVNDNTSVLSAFDRTTGTPTELLALVTQIDSLAVRPVP